MSKRKNKGKKEAKEEKTNQDEMQQEELQKIIDAKVQEGIQKALAGVTPKANTKPQGEIQKEEFSRMSYRQRLELFKNNPGEYNKLAKGGV